MESFEFDGTYADADSHESEAIVWRVSQYKGARPPQWGSGFELSTRIRGVHFSGLSFDTLDPDDDHSPSVVGLRVNAGGLHECVLTGALPCVVEIDGELVTTAIDFRLDLTANALANVAAPANLQLSLSVGTYRLAVVDDWFEGGMLKVEAALPENMRLRSCVTCLYSDYSPGGHGLIGILCHRDAKAQYLAVRSKLDYWSVPVTEEVLETYLCGEYQRRVPGTGYRG